jgi:hypothetical protein
MVEQMRGEERIIFGEEGEEREKREEDGEKGRTRKEPFLPYRNLSRFRILVVIYDKPSLHSPVPQLHTGTSHLSSYYSMINTSSSR